MEETVDFFSYFKILKKRIKFIFVVIIFCVGGMTFLNGFIIKPVYEATTQILVNSTTNTSDEMDTTDIQTNIQLIETYSVIIESPAILDKVVLSLEDEGIDTTVEDLQESITVTSESNTQIMNITVEGGNPENTALVANTIAEVFQEEIVEIMQVENVTILSEATDGEKVRPNALLSTVFAAGVGLVVGIAIVFLREYLDTTIKNEETITEMFGIPILGTISDFEMIDENKNGKNHSGNEV